jgi:hypothetical protein
MRPSQAEILLRVAENTYLDGDEAIAKMRQLGADHMRRIMEDSELIAQARELNERDKQRFSQYLPAQQRPELAQGQQKTAALPLRKAAE